MKLSIFAFLLMSVFQAQAALQPAQDSNFGFAHEVLSMPELNREQIAQKRSSDLYPALISIAHSAKESMAVRWKALTLASSLGNRSVVVELQNSLKSSEWFMRNAALVALEKNYPEQSQAAAQSLLKDKALVVRSAAVDVLGRQLTTKNRDLLWEELNATYNFHKSASLWIRSQILTELSDKPEPRESSLFVKALQDKDRKMHAPAIAALEKIVDQKLGKGKETVAQKRELWLQWAKAHPQVTTSSLF